MKSAVFEKPGIIHLMDSPEPILEAGWSLIAIGAVGICGTDLHMLHGDMGDKNGIRPGHEISGVVERCSKGGEIREGDLVTIEPAHACGTCNYCIQGLPNHCKELAIFGVTRDGGLTELMAIPEKCLYSVSKSLPIEVVALCEPLAVCLRVARLTKIQKGDTVAILGGGSIGLISIIAAKHLGADEIHVIAKYQHQRELALELGAKRVYANSDQALKEIGDRHIDISIETVGSRANTLDKAIYLTKPGGTIGVLGAFSDKVSISAFLLMVKELRIVGSSCYGHEAPQADFSLASSILSFYKDSLLKLVTHCFSLDQVSEAFRAAENKNERSIKVQIKP